MGRKTILTCAVTGNLTTRQHHPGLLGGHVRVGMEDNVHIEQGRLCRDNAELCEKAVTIVENLGGPIATPAEARELLGLAPRRVQAA